LVVADQNVVWLGLFVTAAFSAFRSVSGLGCPIDKHKFAFEGSSPESRRLLPLFEENSAKTDVWRVHVENLKEQKWLPRFGILLKRLLADVSAITYTHKAIFGHRDEVLTNAFVVVFLVNFD
jgi:hypothetical protein